MTITAVPGLDCIFDITHPDGKITRPAKPTGERDVIAAANHALAVGRFKAWLTILVKLGFARGYVDQPKGSAVFGRARLCCRGR